MKTTEAQIKRKHYMKNVVFFSVLAIAALLFLYSLTFQETYQGFIQRLELQIQENNIQSVLTFIIIEALAVMLSPLSSVPLAVIAVDIWGKSATVGYSLIGGLVGTTIAYLIGMHALYRLLKRLIPIKDIEHYSTLVSKKSSFWLIVLFVMAMPVEIPGYVLGIARYPYKKFFVAVALGYLPFYVLTVFAGQAFIEQNSGIFVALMASLIAFFCISLYFFYKKVQK